MAFLIEIWNSVIPDRLPSYQCGDFTNSFVMPTLS